MGRKSGTRSIVLGGLCVALIVTLIPLCVREPRSEIGASLAGTGLTPSERVPSAELTQHVMESIGLTDLRKAVGATGAGQVIAVVDSGIDPTGPGLRDGNGVSRVREWLDVTGEGRAAVLGAFSARDGYVDVEGTKLKVSGLASLGGTLKVGVLPRGLAEALGSKRYFVVFDPVTEGVFEAVAVDTDGDLGFDDEPVLFRYRGSLLAASMTASGKPPLSLVVVEVGSSGDSVTFGYDLNGHGTSLAAIAAATGPGDYSGVAPEALLFAIKAVGADGKGDWADIIDGVRYAIDRGADVILVGGTPDRLLTDPAWASVQTMARNRGANLVIPSGNRGPGLGTLTATSKSGVTLVAGGYIPGVTIAGASGNPSPDQRYVYSSCGPDPAGNRGVSLVAPAVTTTPIRDQRGADTYRTLDGTSVSSAFVAGGAALLRQLGNVHGKAADAEKVATSLMQGAVPFGDLTPPEQGNGKLNLARAWNFMTASVLPTQMVLSRKWDGTVSADGLWVRGGFLGALPLWVDNFSPLARRVEVSFTGNWLSVDATHLNLGAVSQRSIWARGLTDLKPGFYSGEILVDDPETPGLDSRMTVSSTIPYEFTTPSDIGPAGRVDIDIKRPGEGQVERIFLDVPASSEGLSLRFARATGQTYALYNPDGQLVMRAKADDVSPVFVGLPESGEWQLAIIGAQGLERSLEPLHVEARLEGLFVVDSGYTAAGEQLNTVLSDPSGATYRLSAPISDREWMYRRSGQISATSASTVSYPSVDENTAALSLRLGTATGSRLQAYIYWFDGSQGKWVEVAQGATDAFGRGSILVRQPVAGRYVAYVEAYGVGQQIYAEVEALTLAGSPDEVSIPMESSVARSMSSFGQLSESLLVKARTADQSPKYVVVQSCDAGRILGLLERSIVDAATLPVIQVSPGTTPAPGRLRTLRAWTADGIHPLDIVVSVGKVRYQLDLGKVTATIPVARDATFRIPGTKAMFTIPLGRDSSE